MKNPTHAWTKPRGNEHDFLGMIMHFRDDAKVDVDMTKYMKKMVVDFEKKYTLNKTATTPAANDLFGKDEDSPKIEKEMAEDVHTPGKSCSFPLVDFTSPCLPYFFFVHLRNFVFTSLSA